MAAICTSNVAPRVFDRGLLGATINARGLVDRGEAIAAKSYLAAIPAELAIEVLVNLDLAGVLALSASCKQFRQLYLANKSLVVFSALQSDVGFEPLDGLFRVLAMRASDVEQAWSPKEVRFRRRVLCKGDGDAAAVAGATVQLGDADADRAIEVCKAVRGWEDVFPYYRFLQRPECARLLNSDEKRRLRAAVYTWMQYHFYFDGGFGQLGNMLLPRVNLLRMLDSGELTDLEDLWRTVRSLVECLCPSEEMVMSDAGLQLSVEEAQRIGWGSTTHWEIVSTMMKLGPERLLYYTRNWHLYSKEQVVDEIRREQPQIEENVESLSQSLEVMMRSLEAPPKYEERSSAGILDWEEGRQPVRPWFRAGGQKVIWMFTDDGAAYDEDEDGDWEDWLRDEAVLTRGELPE